MTFTAMNYLGSVTANTRAKVEEVLSALYAATGKTLTHCWGYNTGGGEHGTGRAVDFMVVNDRAAGDFIADYLWTHRARLGLAWEIWQQAIRNVNNGSYGPAGRWNGMPDRGNGTANHRDHVHVLFGSDAYAPPGNSPAPSPAPPASTSAAPPFPLPGGWYFGPRSGPRESVSGYVSYREDLRRWQARMAERGWTISVDGLYGDQTAAVARAFQREKGLAVDGLIGSETWRAAWGAPIT